MQAVSELAKVGEASAQFGEDFVEFRPGLLRHLGVRSAPRLEVEGGRYEPLLGAVMQVALDLPASSVGGVDDASARGANFGELCLDDLSLAKRLLGGAANRDVEDRAMQPAAPVTAILSLPAFQDPAQLTVAAQDAVLQVERPAGVDRLGDRSLDVLAIVGMDDAGERPHGVVDEVTGGIAGDPLDLVA